MGRTTLVFVKYPEPGRVKTRLAASLGEEPAARAYRAMAEHLLSKLKDPVVCFDPVWPEAAYRRWLGPRTYVPQEGEDLGLRMAAALGRAVRETGDRAVLIGSDSPQLDQAALLQAFEALEDHQVVLGPCRDGGYYLLGVRDRVPDLFTGVPWSTDRVLETTLERAGHENVSVALLEKEYDVDTYEDLQHALGDPRVALALEVPL